MRTQTQKDTIILKIIKNSGDFTEVKSKYDDSFLMRTAELSLYDIFKTNGSSYFRIGKEKYVDLRHSRPLKRQIIEERLSYQKATGKALAPDAQKTREFLKQREEEKNVFRSIKAEPKWQTDIKANIAKQTDFQKQLNKISSIKNLSPLDEKLEELRTLWTQHQDKTQRKIIEFVAKDVKEKEFTIKKQRKELRQWG